MTLIGTETRQSREQKVGSGREPTAEAAFQRGTNGAEQFLSPGGINTDSGEDEKVG